MNKQLLKHETHVKIIYSYLISAYSATVSESKLRCQNGKHLNTVKV